MIILPLAFTACRVLTELKGNRYHIFFKKATGFKKTTKCDLKNILKVLSCDLKADGHLKNSRLGEHDQSLEGLLKEADHTQGSVVFRESSANQINLTASILKHTGNQWREKKRGAWQRCVALKGVKDKTASLRHPERYST